MKQKLSLFLFCTFLLIGFSCQDEALEEKGNEKVHSDMTLSNPAAYVQGVVYLKLTEEAADTVVPRKLAEKMGVEGLVRVFPEDKRYVKRHREAGLQCWYYARLSKGEVLTRAVNNLSDYPEIANVEPIHQAAIEGSTHKGKQSFSTKPYDFSAMPAIARATTDYPFNDPLLHLQWHYQNDGTTLDGVSLTDHKGRPAHAVAGADINLFKAWKVTTGCPEVIVNVVDGGIFYRQTDLAANMHVNEAEKNGQPGVDDDGNGYIDDIYGFNFVTIDSINFVGDIVPNDHGTHVAGTIAAVNNNGIGVCGVAGGDGTPGSGVRLLSSQTYMLNEEDGTNYPLMDIPAAIVYGADNGAVISQNSWGYLFEEWDKPHMDEATQAAIDYFIKYAGTDADGNQVGPMKGGIVIFAAGNDDSDMPCYPPALPEVTAVAAIGFNFKKTYYSNYGDWVDIVAPGGEYFMTNDGNLVEEACVLSTFYEYWNPERNCGAYLQGTSMACPHVSGIAALIVSKYGGPGFTPDDLRRRLSMGLKDIDQYNPDYIGKLGKGYIDAEACLREMHHAPVSTNHADVIYMEKLNTSQTVNLNDYFADEDGDALKYGIASISPASLLQASIDGENLTVTGLGYGEVQITVKATDPFKYSGEAVVNVKLWDASREIACYPNPVVDKLSIQIGKGVTGEIKYCFYNSGGRKALEGKAEASPYKATVIEVSRLKAGSYTLQIEAGGQRITKTIIKK